MKSGQVVAVHRNGTAMTHTVPTQLAPACTDSLCLFRGRKKGDMVQALNEITMTWDELPLLIKRHPYVAEEDSSHLAKVPTPEEGSATSRMWWNVPLLMVGRRGVRGGRTNVDIFLHPSDGAPHPLPKTLDLSPPTPGLKVNCLLPSSLPSTYLQVVGHCEKLSFQVFPGSLAAGVRERVGG